jgi:hypothetical protein
VQACRSPATAARPAPAPKNKAAARFTFPVRETLHDADYTTQVISTAHPYIADTRPHLDAADLLAVFGIAATREAAARAERSRQLGNHLHFCRWREVGRLLAVLGADCATGTVH